MSFATQMFLCLALVSRYILADEGGVPDTIQPKVGVETEDSGQGQSIPKETIQGQAASVKKTTVQVIETVFVSALPASSSVSPAPASSSISPAPASSSPVSPPPVPAAKEPDTVFCGTSSEWFLGAMRLG
jgi:hypothetical protein